MFRATTCEGRGHLVTSLVLFCGVVWCGGGHNSLQSGVGLVLQGRRPPVSTPSVQADKHQTMLTLAHPAKEREREKQRNRVKIFTSN